MVQEINLPSTIEQKELFKASLRERILEGQVNPLEFYRQAKLITDVVDELKKDAKIFEYACEEIEKFGKEKANVGGSILNTGSKTTYDYKSCGDSVWNELKQKIEDREKYLKALPPEGAVSPETGELVKPPIAKVSTFIAVKI